MTYIEFFNKYNNTYQDFDGALGAQCFDLVNFWAVALGNPPFTGDYAYQIYDQAGTAYTQIPNTPDAVPQQGDVVVWSGVYNGGPGHCGIANGTGNTSTFECFEQNDPLGANCHIKVYDYTDVLGWLRPIIQSPTVPVPSDTFTLLVTKSTAYDAFVAAGYNSITDVNNKVSELEKELSECNNKVVSQAANIPIPVTTTSGSTIVSLSTLETTSANNAEAPISTPAVAQPVPIPTPIKPPFSISYLIRKILLSTYDVLKKLFV